MMGIGGVGMAGVAFHLHRAGAEISGCDLYETPRTEWLRANGIEVLKGHSAEHAKGADLLVVTPAVDGNHAEVQGARAVKHRGEVLAEIFNAEKCGIAVCGTHGKTTTSTFIAKLLVELGADPSWCIGGETGEFPVAGKGDGPFVIEADESDGTLALYRAKILVITSLDYDHPDHFKTAEEYRECYRAAERSAEEVVISEELPMDGWEAIRWMVRGEHNVRNARAAAETALRLGYGKDEILKALPVATAELPDRRFEVIWPSDGRVKADGVTVVTDYAHHPAELKCAIDLARTYRPRRVRVMFQPHRYSRTAAFRQDFPKAFEAADEVVLVPVYAAFEQPIAGGDIGDLYQAFRENAGTTDKVKLARNANEAWRHLISASEAGDILMILGAGDLVKVIPAAKRQLAGEEAPPKKRIIIGAGSNTWRSELRTDEEYVKSDSPAGRAGSTLGIPWMVGIPGTIGGWVKMNAGAFGHSISEALTEVNIDGKWVKAEDCGFGYRKSGIAGEVRDVRLRDYKAEATAEEYLARRKRFPAGTKGSVFKNPEGDFAGRLLEESGCKGLRVGGAYVWAEHANVIVQGEGARNSDFLALARMMREKVRAKFGVELEYEVKGLENNSL